MLKKRIENIKTIRQEKKQNKNFREGIINTLKLLISDKKHMVVQVLSALNSQNAEEKIVKRYEDENPNHTVVSFAVKNESGDVLFMVTKIYGKIAQYRFDFGAKAPAAYFQPDAKTIKKLYKMVRQENSIRYRQGYMMEDARKQKKLLDWLNER